MEGTVKIFFVEDEPSLGLIVKDSLISRGFDVKYYMDGQEALDVFPNVDVDVYVLDVMLPNVDGFTIAREIRKIDKHTPILFLTAKSQPENVVEGFEIGGNDYLKKPFSIEELIVRVKALAGRIVVKPEESDVHMIGNIQFNKRTQTLSYEGKSRTLTYRENQILVMLYEKRNRVLERKEVLKQLWGDDNFFNARSMDVFITRLRKYLKDDSNVKIVNIRGIGYKLIFDVQ